MTEKTDAGDRKGRADHLLTGMVKSAVRDSGPQRRGSADYLVSGRKNALTQAKRPDEEDAEGESSFGNSVTSAATAKRPWLKNTADR